MYTIDKKTSFILRQGKNGYYEMKVNNKNRKFKNTGYKNSCDPMYVANKIASINNYVFAAYIVPDRSNETFKDCEVYRGR